MRDLKVWKFILQNLEINLPVILMCVVESFGSSPGRKGFKMAVTPEEMCGSIGGGIMEHKFVEMAKEKLSLEEGPILKKQFHRKSEVQNRSGMICSGEQTVLIFRVDENSKTVIRKIISTLEENKSGSLSISSTEINFEAGNNNEDISFKIKSETDFEYSELVGYRNRLHIVGGGHCALALSKLMNALDFHISIYEDRHDLNTLAENDFVHEKVFVNDYFELKDLIQQQECNYVVVMTFGYRTDDVAVRSLAGKNFNYIGVLGSASKMQQMFQDWRAAGLSSEWLAKIHSPAGLQIKSETPEEIAISIAAEIISIKNNLIVNK